MVVFSKNSFEEVFSRYECCDVLHPWNKNCIFGTTEFILSTLRGGLKFFTIMYGVQILFRLRARKKIYYEKELKAFIQSLIFISLYGSSFVGLNCFFRKILGKYSFYMTVFGVPMISAGFVFLESHGRKTLNVTTFLTGAIEGYYRRGVSLGSFGGSLWKETLAFMLLNGSLMAMLRHRRESSSAGDGTWFFTPLKINKSDQQKCSHQGDCIKSLLKDVFKFGGIALLISTLKMVATSFKSPSKVLPMFFKWTTWRLSAFVATYIGIFKIVSCRLCLKKGDSLRNSFAAGLLGGLAYPLSPSVTILASLLTALIKTIGCHVKESYELPDLPYLEVTFMLANWYMLYLRAFDRKNCPRYLYNMLNMVTVNKSEEMNNCICNILEQNFTVR